MHWRTLIVMLVALVLLILFVQPLMLCALFKRIIVSHMQSMEEVGHQLSRQLLNYYLFEVNRHLEREVDILVVNPSHRQYQHHYNPYLFILTISHPSLQTYHQCITLLIQTYHQCNPLPLQTHHQYNPLFLQTYLQFRLLLFHIHHQCRLTHLLSQIYCQPF